MVFCLQSQRGAQLLLLQQDNQLRAETQLIPKTIDIMNISPHQKLEIDYCSLLCFRDLTSAQVGGAFDAAKSNIPSLFLLTNIAAVSTSSWESQEPVVLLGFESGGR